MAIPIVPIGPGVPTLPTVNTIIALADQVLADLLSLSIDESDRWGLFLDGEPVITAESVVSFEFKQNYRISTFAIEPSNQQSAGGFESYNKVQMPFDVGLRFATGDTPAARQALLESAAAACASLDLMDAVTPEAVYQSLNPTHFDYRRTAQNGLALIVLDLFCEQVRTTASSTFTNAQQSGTGATANNAVVPTGGSDTFNALYSARITQPFSASASPTISNGTVQPGTATNADNVAFGHVGSSIQNLPL